jgi:hypothetical protein
MAVRPGAAAAAVAVTGESRSGVTVMVLPGSCPAAPLKATSKEPPKCVNCNHISHASSQDFLRDIARESWAVNDDSQFKLETSCQ